MKAQSWLARAVAVMAAGAAMSMGTGVAEAAGSSVSIRPTASLEARGAAVISHVTVQCPKGQSARLFVGVSQRVRGDHVTSGFGGKNVNCTGSAQMFRVPVTPFDRAFRRGVAFAQASIEFGRCNENGCTFVSKDTYRTINVV